jgi:hypothetical protein
MPGRDNGFVARHYVRLADLDPRLADAMLDALRAEGIAAYVVPSTGQLGGYLEVHLPERPRDRLWVDREHHDRATTLLNAQNEGAGASAPEPQPADVPADVPAGPVDETDATEQAWAQLVAGFDQPTYEGTNPWPDAEDLPADVDNTASLDPDTQQTLPLEGFAGTGPEIDRADDGAPVPRRIVRPAERFSEERTAEIFRNADLPSDEYDPLSVLDEHFVPAPPPPLPRLRRGTRWALSAVIVGVALIVGRSLTDAIPDAVALGVLAIVGGFVGLVAMMREDRPSDSDPDDGAVV